MNVYMCVYIHMNICHFATIPLQKQLRWWQLRRASSFAERLLPLPLAESRRESSTFPSGAACVLWDNEQYVACVCVGTFVCVFVHVSIFCACVFVCERETERIREGKGGRQKERERVHVRVLVCVRAFACVSLWVLWVPTTLLTEIVGKCVYGYLGVHGPDATVKSGLTIVSRHKQSCHWRETHAQQAQKAENIAHPMRAHDWGR